MLLELLQQQLQQNPIVAGGAGMAAVGWVLMQARAIPGHLARLVQDQFSATLTVYTEDDIYRLLNLWLARHPSSAKSRRLNVAEYHDKVKDKDGFELTPGPGYHLLREGMRFYLVHRVVEDKSSGGDMGRRRKQTLHITTFGRSRAPLERLLAQVKEVEEDKTTVPVYMWGMFEFHLTERRRRRPLSTIYMPAEQREAIRGDLAKFFDDKETYERRRIPWRRGHLYEGPPGTGKSSLIFALASEFGKAVYIINIASIDNDNTLMRAMNATDDGFVVIEDIDAAGVVNSREDGGSGNVATAAAASESGVTLSGLLNAIDGIGAKEGRVLFLTSNCPETLDPALIRAGRCDRRFHLGLADAEVARQMAQEFFPGEDPQRYVDAVAAALPMPAADLQGRLLSL